MLARRACLDEPVSPAVIRSLRDRIELLEEENRQLQEAARPLVLFPRDWRLTKSEARMLTAMMRSSTGYMSKESLLTAAYGLEPDVDIKIIDVFICKIRKKLSAAGVEVSILTAWGQGFGLSAGGRATLKAALEGGAEADEVARQRELETSLALLTERAVEREVAIVRLAERVAELEGENTRLRAVPEPARGPSWQRWAKGPKKRGPLALKLRGGRHGR